MAEAVASTRVPYVPITLEIPELGFRRELEALADTGFTQGVALPSRYLPAGARALTDAAIRMADGELRHVPAYLGKVRISSTLVDFISVFELGTEPIIGLDIITQFRVVIEHNVSITFEP